MKKFTNSLSQMSMLTYMHMLTHSLILTCFLFAHTNEHAEKLFTHIDTFMYFPTHMLTHSLTTNVLIPHTLM